MRIHSLLIAAIACLILIFGVTACAEKPKIRFEKISPLDESYSESYSAYDPSSEVLCTISIPKDTKNGIDILESRDRTTGETSGVREEYRLNLTRLSDGTVTAKEPSPRIEKRRGNSKLYSNDVPDRDNGLSAVSTLSALSVFLGRGTNHESTSSIFQKHFFEAATSDPIPEWVKGVVIDRFGTVMDRLGK